MKTIFTKTIKFHKCKIGFLFFAIGLIISKASIAQNPLSAASGFGLFTEGNFTISAGDIEGSMAIGGSLVVNGSSQRTANNTTGGLSYVTIGSIKYALVVGGDLANGVSGVNFKIDGKTGSSTATSDHFIRFSGLSGDVISQVGSASPYTLNVGVSPLTTASNIRLVSNSTTQLGTSISNSTQLVTFSTAFSTLRTQATAIANCANNVGISIGTNGSPTVTLGNNPTNVWNVSGTDLNSYSNGIILAGTMPDATHPLIINVNAAGTFNWNNLKLNMGCASDLVCEQTRAPYIIWNFYNATALTIKQSNLIFGSIFAPNADLRNDGTGNISGQVVVKTFTKVNAGELHIATFAGAVTCSATIDCSCVNSVNNLLKNPSFESGAVNWLYGGASGGSFTAGAGFQMCGANGGFNNHGSTLGGTPALTYQDIAMAAGSIVTMNGYAGVHTAGLASGCNPKLQMLFLNSSLGEISGFSKEVTVTWDVDIHSNSLEQYSLTGTAPAGTAYVRIQSSISCASQTMKLDAFCLSATCSTAAAGVDQTKCANNSFIMAANTVGASETGTWTVVAGAATIGSVNSPTSTITVTTSPATLRWTVSRTSPVCSNFDDVILTNTIVPAPIIGTRTQPTCIVTTGSVILSGLPSTGTWTITRSPGAVVTTGTGTSTTISNLPANATYTFTVKNAELCTSVASANVVINAIPTAPSITSVVSSVKCNGALTGSIDISVTGGLSPYSYLWSNNATSQDISSVGAGTYTVTVTDANGCTKTAIATITQPTALVLTSTQTNVSCNGGANGTIDLTVTGGTSGYTYNWGAGQPTTQDRTGLSAGSYTVTVTDAYGCTKTATATITQPNPIALTVVPTNVKCNGGSTGAIDLTVTGGTGVYTYNWGAGQPITQDRTALAIGTYAVTVTDANGCTKTTSTIITQPNVLAASNTKVDVKCNGASTGSIDLTVAGGTLPYTYNWGTGQPVTEDRAGLLAGSYTVTITDANGCTVSSSATISQPIVMVLTNTQVNIKCYGAATGSVDLTVSGGTSPYTYLWSNNAATQDISSLLAGTYIVTVTDFNGCTQSSSATITEAPVLIASNTKVDVKCQGGATGSIDLTVSGGISTYTYLWSNSAITQDLSGLLAGTYTVTVTDGNGCAKTNSATIAQPAVLVASNTKVDVKCNGAATGSVDLTVSGGTIPYTYLWSNSAITQDLSGLLAGTYTVTVTDFNGCTKTSSATIAQPTVLVASNTKVDVKCNGAATGSVDLTVSGGTTPYTYLWSNSAITQDLTGLLAGTYTVTITDGNGCTKTSSASITEPIVLIVSNTKIDVKCNGAATGSVDLTVSGGTAPYTYLWSNSSITQDLAGLLAGTYTVTVTDGNGCTKTNSATISQPTVLVASNTKVDINCNGTAMGSVDLTVSGGTTPYTYLWSNSAISQDINGLLAGIYTVTVADGNGCTKTSSASIAQPTVLVASSTKVDVKCSGVAIGSVDLTVSGGTTPYSYLWSNNAITQDISGLNAGTYSVTITDFNGCTKTSTAIVGEPSPIDLSETHIDVPCAGGSNGSIDVSVSGGTSPYTYNWGAGQPATQDLAGLSAGTFIVTVTDANGCTKSISVIISQNSGIIVDILKKDVLCNGSSTGAITLTVSGGAPGYTYLWNDGVTTKNRSGLLAGDYSVLIKDINNCSTDKNIKVAEPAALFASLTQNDVKCKGGATGSIDLTVTGGKSPYTYLWSNGNSSQDISTLVAGSYTVTVTDANSCTKVTSTIIIEPSLLVLSNTQIDVKCNGGSTGSINLSVSGGTSPYSFLWTNSATSEDISDLQLGTYSVTVTDANGCTKVSSATISEPNLLDLSDTKVDIKCFGALTGSIDLKVAGGTAPYSYLWSNGSIEEDIFGLAVGTYSVTVTDANGCSKTRTITLDQPLLIIVSNKKVDVKCKGGNNASIDLTVSGGVAPYTYIWSNGKFTEDINALLAGEYSVTVTDANGCSKEQIVLINEPNELVVNKTVDDIKCNGAFTGSINLTIDGGTSPFTYLWSNGATSKDINGLPAGNYSVTVTDNNGCTQISSATVEEPSLLMISNNKTDVKCKGGNSGSIELIISGGTANYTYLWSNGAITKDISNLTIGTYSVTVTDANNCSKTTSITIDEPTLLTLINTTIHVKCNGNVTGSVDLTVTGGNSPYGFLWSNGAITEDISDLEAGSYTVTVTDANGCTKTNSATISQPDILSITYKPVDIKCNGESMGSIDLTVSGGTVPYTYLWSNNAVLDDLSGLLAGEYLVTVTDANGCSKTASITIAEPPVLNLTITKEDVLCHGSATGTVTANASGGSGLLSYSWSTNPAQHTPKAIGLLAGTYMVTVTDENGCTKTESATITEPDAISIGDYIWIDANRNCLQDGNEKGMDGVTVYLYKDSDENNIPDGTAIASTISANNGAYYFNDICKGKYIVSISIPNGFGSTCTSPVSSNDPNNNTANDNNGVAIYGTNELRSNTVNLVSNNFNVDFGLAGIGSIGDFVWSDLNANGVQDFGEPGIPGVTVNLGGDASSTAITDANGYYLFPNLDPGTYTVTFVTPPGYQVSPSNSGSATDATDSDPINGVVNGILLGAGENNMTIDAGFYILASIGDYAWYDWNKNGIQDKLADGVTDEIAMAGITVELYKGDGTYVGTTTTTATGYYHFDNLIPGDYYIASHGQTNPGYIVTEPNVGDDTKDSDIERIIYRSATTTLISGENDNTWDIGSYRSPETLKDPCKCRNNATNSVDGQFDEKVIVEATPGGIWRIVSQTGMYKTTSPEPPETPIPIEVGTLFTQVPGSIDSWEIDFRHIDAEGYTMEITDGIDLLTITNKCYYPDVNLAALPSKVCIYEAPFTLSSNPSVAGIVRYFIVKNGIKTEVTSLDPSIYGTGPIEIEAELTPSDPTLCIDKAKANVSLVTDCLASLGDFVWYDINKDGIQNNNEPGIGGVLVTLTKPDGSKVTQLTGNDGYYLFTNLIPSGSYTVTFGTPNAMEPSASNFGPNDQADSDPINSIVSGIVLAPYEVNTTIDAGFKDLPVLSVKLLNFTANSQEASIVLNWKTIDEKDFSHFEIQRSQNAKEFGFLGKVNSSKATFYNYTDFGPMQGINYYRLKMVNIDGTFNYSKIVSVNYSKSDAFVLIENPAKNGEFILSTNISDPIFKVLTIQGSSIVSNIFLIDKNKYLIKLPNYVAGTYFISVASEGKLYTKKIIAP